MLEKILGFIHLLRPVNCIMMGLAVLIGEIIVYRTLYFPPSILGFITAFTLTGASMVANDYWDRSIDLINEPNRPIASGLVSIRSALFYTYILMIIGLSSALLTNILGFLTAILSLSVSLLYSYRGKKLGLMGNFMVSACVAVPLFYGGLLGNITHTGLKGIQSLLIFDIMFFLAVTGREVNKGITDIEGDSVKGVRTIAVRFGPQSAAVVAVALYLSAVAISVLPYLLSLTSMIYLPLVLIADVGIVASSFVLLRDTSKESAMRTKRMMLIWMSIGLFALFMGGIS